MGRGGCNCCGDWTTLAKVNKDTGTFLWFNNYGYDVDSIGFTQSGIYSFSRTMIGDSSNANLNQLTAGTSFVPNIRTGSVPQFFVPNRAGPFYHTGFQFSQLANYKTGKFMTARSANDSVDILYQEGDASYYYYPYWWTYDLRNASLNTTHNRIESGQSGFVTLTPASIKGYVEDTASAANIKMHVGEPSGGVAQFYNGDDVGYNLVNKYVFINSYSSPYGSDYGDYYSRAPEFTLSKSNNRCVITSGNVGYLSNRDMYNWGLHKTSINSIEYGQNLIRFSVEFDTSTIPSMIDELDSVTSNSGAITDATYLGTNFGFLAVLEQDISGVPMIAPEFEITVEDGNLQYNYLGNYVNNFVYPNLNILEFNIEEDSVTIRFEYIGGNTQQIIDVFDKRGSFSAVMNYAISANGSTDNYWFSTNGSFVNGGFGNRPYFYNWNVYDTPIIAGTSSYRYDLVNRRFEAVGTATNMFLSRNVNFSSVKKFDAMTGDHLDSIPLNEIITNSDASGYMFDALNLPTVPLDPLNGSDSASFTFTLSDSQVDDYNNGTLEARYSFISDLVGFPVGVPVSFSGFTNLGATNYYDGFYSNYYLNYMTSRVIKVGTDEEDRLYYIISAFYNKVYETYDCTYLQPIVSGNSLSFTIYRRAVAINDVILGVYTENDGHYDFSLIPSDMHTVYDNVSLYSAIYGGTVGPFLNYFAGAYYWSYDFFYNYRYYFGYNPYYYGYDYELVSSYYNSLVSLDPHLRLTTAAGGFVRALSNIKVEKSEMVYALDSKFRLYDSLTRMKTGVYTDSTTGEDAIVLVSKVSPAVSTSNVSIPEEKIQKVYTIIKDIEAAGALTNFPYWYWGFGYGYSISSALSELLGLESVVYARVATDIEDTIDSIVKGIDKNFHITNTDTQETISIALPNAETFACNDGLAYVGGKMSSNRIRSYMSETYFETNIVTGLTMPSIQTVEDYAIFNQMPSTIVRPLMTLLQAICNYSGPAHQTRPTLVLIPEFTRDTIEDDDEAVTKIWIGDKYFELKLEDTWTQITSKCLDIGYDVTVYGGPIIDNPVAIVLNDPTQITSLVPKMKCNDSIPKRFQEYEYSHYRRNGDSESFPYVGNPPMTKYPHTTIKTDDINVYAVTSPTIVNQTQLYRDWEAANGYDPLNDEDNVQSFTTWSATVRKHSIGISPASGYQGYEGQSVITDNAILLSDSFVIPFFDTEFYERGGSGVTVEKTYTSGDYLGMISFPQNFDHALISQYSGIPQWLNVANGVYFNVENSTTGYKSKQANLYRITQSGTVDWTQDYGYEPFEERVYNESGVQTGTIEKCGFYNGYIKDIKFKDNNLYVAGNMVNLDAIRPGAFKTYTEYMNENIFKRYPDGSLDDTFYRAISSNRTSNTVSWTLQPVNRAKVLPQTT